MRLLWDAAAGGVEQVREDSWRALRRLRSSPPSAAARDRGRERVFRSALEQSEQFFRAAEAAGVGYEVRPVLVFYGLYQGARAVVAASNRIGREEWRLSGHGMKFVGARALPDVAVKIDARGSPRTAAAALGSPFPAEHTTLRLGELWPMIPESAKAPLTAEGGAVARPALALSEPADHERPAAAEGWDLVRVAGLPRGRFEAEEFEAWLAGYPAFAGWQADPHGGRTPQIEVRVPPGVLETTVMWRADGPQRRLGLPLSPQRHAQWYRGRWWAFPAVAGLSAPLHPLLTWWMVLLALSSLARYEPDQWAGMVDVDRAASPAVPIEHLLAASLDAIPQLLIDAMPEEP